MSEFPIPCGAQYGSNPDRCYRSHKHSGPHWNQWGTTWPQEAP